jgi:hypothetical protein
MRPFARLLGAAIIASAMCGLVFFDDRLAGSGPAARTRPGGWPSRRSSWPWCTAASAAGLGLFDHLAAWLSVGAGGGGLLVHLPGLGDGRLGFLRVVAQALVAGIAISSTRR